MADVCDMCSYQSMGEPYVGPSIGYPTIPHKTKQERQFHCFFKIIRGPCEFSTWLVQNLVQKMKYVYLFYKKKFAYPFLLCLY